MIYSQGVLFEYEIENVAEYSERAKEKLDLLRKNKHYKAIKKVEIFNPRLIEKDGKIKVNISDFENPVIAKAKYVYFGNDENYTWIGDLLLEDKTSVGTIQIISVKGATFGYITAPEIHYSFYDIKSEDEKQIVYLIKHDSELLKKGKCDSNNSAKALKKDSLIINDQHLESRNNGCPPNVRVLVLYTQNASNANPNVSQV
ncbi:MAG TPA: hypothetical protein PKD85_18695, partial [Saprospiraceae bacterium]|nr:hypothetical protein [Saprospiraceae bacterium]